MTPQALIPNYSLPFAEVFHQYTRIFIENTGELEFLTRSGQQLEHVPSWVADYRHYSTARDDIVASKSGASISQDGWILNVRGRRLETSVAVLSRVDPAFNEKKVPARTKAQRARQFEELILKPASQKCGVSFNDMLDSWIQSERFLVQLAGARVIRAHYEAYSRRRTPGKTEPSKSEFSHCSTPLLGPEHHGSPLIPAKSGLCDEMTPTLSQGTLFVR